MARPAPQSIEEPHIERIRAFDLMRGFFLIVILLDHLAYYPSGLDIFTGRGLLYISTAEGFFAISGLVLGIVRGRKLLNKPLRTAAKLLLKRSVQLYIDQLFSHFYLQLPLGYSTTTRKLNTAPPRPTRRFGRSYGKQSHCNIPTAGRIFCAITRCF